MPETQQEKVSSVQKEELEQPWKAVVAEGSQNDAEESVKPQELVKTQALYFEATTPTLAG
jgi:hypothetical protein